MKSINELTSIFSEYKNSKEHCIEIKKGVDWEINIFTPFERGGKKIFSFRLYGKTTGSKYANEFKWYGGVDYSYDLNTLQLERYEYENKLNDLVIKKANILILLKTI